MPTQLIDPLIARTVARRLAGDSQLKGSYLLDRLRSDLEDAVPRAEGLVAETSGIPPPPAVGWDVIDRATWSEVNIHGMTRLLDPLVEKVGNRLASLPTAVRLAQKGVVSVEVGVLLGYISRRVLGQFDLLVPDEAAGERRRRLRGVKPNASLYFVGVNIVETERRFSFVPRDFALWVAVHEVTHRFQFSGVPWLRERFFGLVENYLSSVEIDARGLAARLAHAARKLASGEIPPEERNPIYLLATDEQRRALDEIQALMAVVEGHGNYVMDHVGAEVIPTFARMRRVFEGRRAQTNSIQRAINHAIGLEMKLRQYEIGQRFCETVVAQAGPDALGQLWVSPESFPTMAELKEPQLWLRRVA